MKTVCNRSSILTIILFATLSMLSAQIPEFEIGLLDLEKAPAFVSEYEDHITVGNRIFYVTDGYEKETLYVKKTDDSPAVKLFETKEFDLLGPYGEKLVFQIRDEKEIYVSDGTIEGTTKIYTYGSTNLREFHVVGNNLAFLHYTDLFVSDGTTEGTFSIGGFEGVGNNILENYVFDDKLIFYADDGTHGLELWSTDGTVAGTFRISDLASGASNLSSFNQIVPAAGLLFFQLSRFNTTGSELWLTDGTIDGARMVKDINPGTTGSNPNNFTDAGNRLFFSADGGTYGRELWTSDGTEAGTIRLTDINVGEDDGLAYDVDIVGVNGLALFLARDSSKIDQLWRSDGTLAGTFQLIEWPPTGSFNSTFEIITYKVQSDGKIFLFIRNRWQAKQYELWTTDGSLEHTQLLTQFTEYPENIILTQDQLFFTDRDRLHSSDGTVEGTGQIGEVKADEYFASMNGLYFFTNWHSISSQEVWVSDGTLEGTHVLKEIIEGAENPSPDGFSVIDNQVYFFVKDPAVGHAIYSSDGTSENTRIYLDLDDNTRSSDIERLQSGVGRLFFDNNNILWTSRGNEPQSISLDTFYNDSDDRLHYYKGKGYHVGFDGIFRTDGTITGSGLVVNFGPGNLPNINNVVYNFKDQMWFQINHTEYGREWWKSDGTISGTQLAFETVPGYESSITYFSKGIVMDEYLFFSGTNQSNGIELWVTDGTSDGTHMLKDLNPGPNNSEPENFHLHNNKLFFTTYLPKPAIWVSDGTAEGTILLAEFDSYLRFPKQETAE